jgi:hypothetical protein
MGLVLFENGKRVGEITDWVITPYVPVYKNVLGKKVLSGSGNNKDECSFVSPKPVRRTSQLSVREDDLREFILKVKTVKGGVHIVAEIFSEIRSRGAPEF